MPRTSAKDPDLDGYCTTRIVSRFGSAGSGRTMPACGRSGDSRSVPGDPLARQDRWDSGRVGCDLLGGDPAGGFLCVHVLELAEECVPGAVDGLEFELRRLRYLHGAGRGRSMPPHGSALCAQRVDPEGRRSARACARPVPARPATVHVLARPFAGASRPSRRRAGRSGWSSSRGQRRPRDERSRRARPGRGTPSPARTRRPSCARSRRRHPDRRPSPTSAGAHGTAGALPMPHRRSTACRAGGRPRRWPRCRHTCRSGVGDTIKAPAACG